LQVQNPSIEDEPLNHSAWVFPGQGSQFVGMGRDLYEAFAEARAVFDAADDALGARLSRICFEGPEAELTDTINAQPAILTHSIAALELLKATLGSNPAMPLFAAGHSLGEYSALVAAGSLDFEDAVRLVRARGAAMKRAGERRPGMMAAILGFDDEKLIQVCSEAGAVQVANFNAPGQIVISGERRSGPCAFTGKSGGRETHHTARREHCGALGVDASRRR
jgi:[acyl-carrier-protein] S-malonyltransferase